MQKFFQIPPEFSNFYPRDSSSYSIRGNLNKYRKETNPRSIWGYEYSQLPAVFM